jgi:hypothetical protein
MNIEYFLKLNHKLKYDYSWLESTYPDFLRQVIDWCYFLPNDTSLKIKIYYFVNNKKSIYTCLSCGKNVRFTGRFSTGFSDYCSIKCSSNSVDVRGRTEKTNTDKYGGIAPICNVVVKEKSKKTSIEKYGVDNYTKTLECKEKTKETSVKKYGTVHPLKNDGVKEKLKKKNNELYGCDWITQSDGFKEKSKKTIIDKYGVDNISKSDFIKNKKKNTHDSYEYTLLINRKFLPQYNDECIDVEKSTKKDIYYNCNLCNSHTYINKTLYHSRYLSNNLKCVICNPIGNNLVSNIEKKIRQLFIDNNINIIENDRSILNGKEIDIFIPEYNIGIEFNGLYWHSEECGKDKNYHISKTKLALSKGIKLIHIFEDEWLNTPEIVKSRILNLLDKTPNKIYGRKCIIKELTNNECKSFLNENHLQGYTPATYNIGLFYNNELVSLMTFGKRKITGKNSLELIRFCNKINTNVMGSASKLFKYFIEKYKPEELISYADIRWSGINPDVTLYNKLGFKLKHMSSPNYWYNYANIRYHRYNFRKDKLIKDGFDPNKTEREIMLERGYTKIWDCGNLVFTFKQ